MKKSRKIISVLVALTLVLSLSTPTFAAYAAQEVDEAAIDPNAAAIAQDEEMMHLLNERLQLWNEKMANASMTLMNEDGVSAAELTDQSFDTQIDEIETQLASLGVQEVSPYDLGLDLGIQPLIDKPSDGIYKWFLSTPVNYTYNGVQYQVQTLSAQPNTTDCKLYDSGAKVQHAPGGIMAGGLAAMGAWAQYAVSKLKVTAVSLTMYQALKAFVEEGLSTSTIVKNVEAVYQWNYSGQMVFRYVKRLNETSWSLPYIYSTASGVQRYDIHTVTFGNTVKTDIEGEQKSSGTIMASGASNIVNAVKAYAEVSAPKSAYIWSIDITGVDNEFVHMVNIPAFIGPGQMLS